MAISYFDSRADSDIAKDLVKILADAEQDIPEWLKIYAESSGSSGFTSNRRGNFMSRDVRGDFSSNVSNHVASSGSAATSNDNDEEEW